MSERQYIPVRFTIDNPALIGDLENPFGGEENWGRVFVVTAEQLRASIDRILNKTLWENGEHSGKHFEAIVRPDYDMYRSGNLPGAQHGYEVEFVTVVDA